VGKATKQVKARNMSVILCSISGR